MVSDITTRAAAPSLSGQAYFTLGLTQEQQTPSNSSRDRFTEFLETGAYPALAKVGRGPMLDDPFDARFDYGIARLLGAV